MTSGQNIAEPIALLTVPLEPSANLIGFNVERQNGTLFSLLHRCGTSQEWFRNCFINPACFGFV